MRNYTTQMDAARKGILTPEMKTVAEKEHFPEEKLMALVAEGKVVICANKKHTCLDPEGIGSMLRTKVNVNLGVSRDCKDYDIEMEKVMSAVNLGAEAIMDLSSHGNTQPFRQKLTRECPVMIGTVPVYDSVIHYQRDLATLTAQDFIDVIRLHAEDGVDFVTLHCGITRKTIDQIRKHKRKMNIVSRGGSLVFAWMSMTGEENPFYEYFDQILEICEEYDVTISLGDACRPGCLADATDVCQIEELVRLGELTKRAWDHNVQVMVEGPGHVPLNQVAANMEVQKSLCMGAPFYVLGPLVTDIAPGYDHITGAIGGAVAAMSGAAFLCYVTPAEHLALPNVEDVKQGIIASKIAAHAADIAKGIPGARDISDFRDLDSINAYHELTGQGVFTKEEMLCRLRKKSRDNARTPFQWSDDANAGFTTGNPWIMINPNYREINAREQLAREDSVFHYYQKLIRLRKSLPVMVYGSYDLLLPEDPGLYVYTRTLDEEALLVICNFSSKPRAFSLPEGWRPGEMEPVIGNYPDPSADLRPYEAIVYRKSKGESLCL